MRAECGLLASKITGLVGRSTSAGSPAPVVSGIVGPPLPPQASATSGSPAASRTARPALADPRRVPPGARACLACAVGVGQRVPTYESHGVRVATHDPRTYPKIIWLAR